MMTGFGTLATSYKGMGSVYGGNTVNVDESDQLKLWRGQTYDGFLKMSTVNESDFFALVIAGPGKTRGFIDYTFWRLLCRSQQIKMDQITILTTNEPELEDLEFDDIKLEKDKLQEQVMDISSDLEIEDFSQFLSEEKM